MIFEQKSGNITAGILYPTAAQLTNAKNYTGVEEFFRVIYTHPKNHAITEKDIVVAIQPSKDYGSTSKYSDGNYLYIVDDTNPIKDKRTTYYQCFILNGNTVTRDILSKQKNPITTKDIATIGTIGTSDVITKTEYKKLVAGVDPNQSNSTVISQKTFLDKTLNQPAVTVTNKQNGNGAYKDKDKEQENQPDYVAKLKDITIDRLRDPRMIQWAMYAIFKSTTGGENITQFKNFYRASWKQLPNGEWNFDGDIGRASKNLIRFLKSIAKDPTVKADKSSSITPEFRNELFKTLKQQGIQVLESVNPKVVKVQLSNFLQPLFEQFDLNNVEEKAKDFNKTNATRTTSKTTSTSTSTTKKSSDVSTSLKDAVVEALSEAGWGNKTPPQLWSFGDNKYGIAKILIRSSNYLIFKDDGTITWAYADNSSNTGWSSYPVGAWDKNIKLDATGIPHGVKWITGRGGVKLTASDLFIRGIDSVFGTYYDVANTDKAFQDVFKNIDAQINSTVWGIKMTIEDELGGYKDMNDNEDAAWDEVVLHTWKTTWSKRMDVAEKNLNRLPAVSDDSPYKYWIIGAKQSIANIRACFASGSDFSRVFHSPSFEVRHSFSSTGDIWSGTNYKLVYYLSGKRDHVWIDLDF
jgi:hypothetical protein